MTKHTEGKLRVEPLGGCSTLLIEQRPSRNDTRIPPYGYTDSGKHCIAYPFIEDDGRTRLDFVCFSHDDAARLALCWNEHDELVEAVTRLLNYAENTESEFGIELASAANARAILTRIREGSPE